MEDDFADPDGVERAFGLTAEILIRIGSISAIAGSIEMQLQMVVWSLEGRLPLDQPHELERCQLERWLDRLNRRARSVLDWSPEAVALVAQWSVVARTAFDCRNAILHGVPATSGAGLSFRKNHSLIGEKRTREPVEFSTDLETLGHLRHVFAALLRTTLLMRDLANAGRPGNGYEVLTDLDPARRALARADAILPAIRRGVPATAQGGN